MVRPKKPSIGHVACLLTCLVLLLGLSAPQCPAADRETVRGKARALSGGGCPDLIELIQDVTPTVVNISIERHMLQNSSTEPPPLFRSPRGWYDDRAKNRQSFQLDTLGSGLICASSGYIITNAHVVEGASKILVTLSTGKVVTAKVVAVHPKVDLALIKIKPPYPLKRARIGDSSEVQVGEWVLAVGNPFGLGRTVTLGIVSGTGRFIGLGADDNFIQTDASINPGNSGGPLFNMAGEVIGVNTAIIASGKGIGFSIPSNYIKALTHAPTRLARPTRGWLGIYVEDPTVQQSVEMGLTEPRGTLVDEVLSGTPAAQAGLKKGDLILKAGGEQVRSGRHLSRIVATAKPGDVLSMTILRAKRTGDVDIIVGKSPE